MAKDDSDFSRMHVYGDVVLEKDNPEKRESALKFLIRQGQEDLADMIGVHNPIPNYGVRP